MKREVAEKFVTALRSETYEQVRDNECTIVDGGICFCAMGVLYDLFHKETGRGEWVATGRNGSRYFSIPVEVVNVWAGTDFNVTSRIVTMNDLHEKSFNEIADYIEGKFLS